jgi:hypothetical protein
VNGLPISGPWIYPILLAAGLSDEQMRARAREVIDTLNAWLVKLVKPLPNVNLLDMRGTLELAAPTTRKQSNDWMDEIHALPEAWSKLANEWWIPALTRILA